MLLLFVVCVFDCWFVCLFVVLASVMQNVTPGLADEAPTYTDPKGANGPVVEPLTADLAAKATRTCRRPSGSHRPYRAETLEWYRRSSPRGHWASQLGGSIVDLERRRCHTQSW